MATPEASLAQTYNAHKLQELIVYVAYKSLGDPRFGKTKLNKILFFSDFVALRQTGASITGAIYQHLPQGPCPQQLLPALNALGDDVSELQEQSYGFVQKRLVPRRTADLGAFSGQEISIVDRVLDDLAPLTNRQVSDLSHETLAWRLTYEGQEIPYGTAFLSGEEASGEDVDWLKEVAASASVERAAR